MTASLDDTLNPQIPSVTEVEAPHPRLDQLSVGTSAEVVGIRNDAESVSRLMAMGVCVGRAVTVIRAGDPMILLVMGTRLGVSAQVAQQVDVTVCPAHSGEGQP